MDILKIRSLTRIILFFLIFPLLTACDPSIDDIEKWAKEGDTESIITELTTAIANYKQTKNPVNESRVKNVTKISLRYNIVRAKDIIENEILDSPSSNLAFLIIREYEYSDVGYNNFIKFMKKIGQKSHNIIMPSTLRIGRYSKIKKTTDDHIIIQTIQDCIQNNYYKTIKSICLLLKELGNDEFLNCDSLIILADNLASIHDALQNNNLENISDEYNQLYKKYNSNECLLDTLQEKRQSFASQKDDLYYKIKNLEIEVNGSNYIWINGFIHGVFMRSGNREIYEISLPYKSTRSLLSTSETKFSTTGNFSMRVEHTGKMPVEVSKDYGAFKQNWDIYVEVTDTEWNEFLSMKEELVNARKEYKQLNKSNLDKRIKKLNNQKESLTLQMQRKEKDIQNTFAKLRDRAKELLL